VDSRPEDEDSMFLRNVVVWYKIILSYFPSVFCPVARKRIRYNPYTVCVQRCSIARQSYAV
jgi:hypothetical protein